MEGGQPGPSLEWPHASAQGPILGAGKAKQGPAEHGRKRGMDEEGGLGIQGSGSSPDLTVLGA